MNKKWIIGILFLAACANQTNDNGNVITNRFMEVEANSLPLEAKNDQDADTLWENSIFYKEMIQKFRKNPLPDTPKILKKAFLANKPRLSYSLVEENAILKPNLDQIHLLKELGALYHPQTKAQLIGKTYTTFWVNDKSWGFD